MKEEFWHQKWKLGDIAFHESEVNPFLIEHFEKLHRIATSLAHKHFIFQKVAKSQDSLFALIRKQ